MSVQPVLTQHISQVWPQVEPFIAAALDHAKGDYTAEQAKVYFALGTWLLLVVVEDGEVKGAIAVEFINRPNDRIAFIIAIGGRLIADNDGFAQLKAILKSHGATKIEGAARESVARLWKLKFGFEEKYKIVEVAL